MRKAVAPRQPFDGVRVSGEDLVSRGVAQWRRERPDLDSSGKEIVGRVLVLQGTILDVVNCALKPHGLQYGSYAVLATLRVSGPPFRMSPSQLKTTLLFSSGGISNLLRRIEVQGLIRRLEAPGDGRGVLVELTEMGLALADRAMPDHAAAEQRLCAGLSRTEQKLLASLLRRMIVARDESGP